MSGGGPLRTHFALEIDCSLFIIFPLYSLPLICKRFYVHLFTDGSKAVIVLECNVFG